VSRDEERTFHKYNTVLDTRIKNYNLCSEIAIFYDESFNINRTGEFLITYSLVWHARYLLSAHEIFGLIIEGEHNL
jgi:hypothetical protein